MDSKPITLRRPTCIAGLKDPGSFNGSYGRPPFPGPVREIVKEPEPQREIAVLRPSEASDMGLKSLCAERCVDCGIDGLKKNHSRCRECYFKVNRVNRVRMYAADSSTMRCIHCKLTLSSSLFTLNDRGAYYRRCNTCRELMNKKKLVEDKRDYLQTMEYKEILLNSGRNIKSVDEACKFLCRRPEPGERLPYGMTSNEGIILKRTCDWILFSNPRFNIENLGQACNFILNPVDEL